MKLGEITKIIYSGQIISRVEAKEDIGDTVLEEKKVLIPKAISAGRINHSDLGTVKIKKEVDDGRITKRGDVIIKLSTPYDTAYIEECDEGLVVPSFCCIIRGIDGDKADAEFIAAYMNTDYIREQLKSKVAGTTMAMIKIADVKGLMLPPVNIEKQRLLGQAYSISCQKQDLLKEMLDNEKKLINNIILESVKEAQENEQ